MSDDVKAAPIPLAAFGALLRPQLTATQVVQNRRPGSPPHTIRVYSAGHPDEIWLKLLEVRHNNERHTEQEWRALIDKYRDEPAHPADPNYPS